MNLSSVTRNLTAGAAGTIRENGANKTITANQAVTPAEHLALMQVLNGGKQSIVLGSQGSATGGSFNLNSLTTTGGVSDLVVPKKVTAIDLLSTMDFSGSLTNFGKLYAVSTTSGQTVASISSGGDILNMSGALISTILPAGNLGLKNTVANLGLSLSAVNDIINNGTISSAGTLTLAAGGAITNAPAVGTTAAATLQAKTGLTLFANGGSISNSGLINSQTGNINISSQVADTIMVNNIGGSITAAKGTIEGRDNSFVGQFDFDITGGTLSAKSINIYSGAGDVTINAQSISGMVNITGGQAEVMAASGSLSLGQMNLTGDPTFYNTNGDIILNNDMSFPGQDLAIIASGNIIANGAQVINTSSLNNGGQITMIAGAPPHGFRRRLPTPCLLSETPHHLSPLIPG